MMSLQALLFDVDGTLADTERDGHRPAFNAAFREFGLDWEWDVSLYGELLSVTGGKERMKHYVDTYRPDYEKPADFDDLVAELHKAKTRHYTAMLAEGKVPMRPGVERLLREAMDAGLRLAIATTTTPENVTALSSTAWAAAVRVVRGHRRRRHRAGQETGTGHLSLGAGTDETEAGKLPGVRGFGERHPCEPRRRTQNPRHGQRLYPRP